MGDKIEGEITIYDPDVLVSPLTSRLNSTSTRQTRVELNRPLYNTCSDTNGPSTKVFMDAKGLLNERLTGDPGDPVFTWDEADPRPWGTYFNESDRRYRRIVPQAASHPRQPRQPRSKPLRTAPDAGSRRGQLLSPGFRLLQALLILSRRTAATFSASRLAAKSCSIQSCAPLVFKKA